MGEYELGLYDSIMIAVDNLRRLCEYKEVVEFCKYDSSPLQLSIVATEIRALKTAIKHFEGYLKAMVGQQVEVEVSEDGTNNK